MTPERREYLEGITEREKTLRETIRVHEYCLTDIKYQLFSMQSSTGIRILKQRIKKQKYIICALKHELERISCVNMYCVNCATVTSPSLWRCDYCDNVQYFNGYNTPNRCPTCGRRIKGWRF